MVCDAMFLDYLGKSIPELILRNFLTYDHSKIKPRSIADLSKVAKKKSVA